MSNDVPHDGGVFDFTAERPFVVTRTTLGNWEWKTYFNRINEKGELVVERTETGRAADQREATRQARAAAGAPAAAEPAALARKPGAFGTVHASTQSSRYGKLPGGVTYTRDFKHDATRWHLCAHGQKQTNCRECLTWFCSCPGSPGHKCTRAA